MSAYYSRLLQATNSSTPVTIRIIPPQKKGDIPLPSMEAGRDAVGEREVGIVVGAGGDGAADGVAVGCTGVAVGAAVAVVATTTGVVPAITTVPVGEIVGLTVGPTGGTVAVTAGATVGVAVGSGA